ncbi:hypothetical protein [Clostridium ihumii]|uniref:hypothetical protein n=1 Tax=Clostridium ihumii TaxID=1470356 RepID=UPI000552E390|nr:hypothetical protein [Clostridium ihumii]
MNNQNHIDMQNLSKNFKPTEFMSNINSKNEKSFRIDNTLSCVASLRHRTAEDMYCFDLFFEKGNEDIESKLCAKYCLSDIFQSTIPFQINYFPRKDQIKENRKYELTDELLTEISNKFNFNGNLAEELVENIVEDCEEICLNQPIGIKTQNKYQHASTFRETDVYYITKINIKHHKLHE